MKVSEHIDENVSLLSDSENCGKIILHANGYKDAYAMHPDSHRENVTVGDWDTTKRLANGSDNHGWEEFVN